MADIFLWAGDDLKQLTFGGRFFGTAGSESVSYLPTVTGAIIDQNVDSVRFLGEPSFFTFQQQGNQLVIWAGAVVAARITVQNDADGTRIEFNTDSLPGFVSAKINEGVMTLGGVRVPTEAPASLPFWGSGIPVAYLTPGADTFGPGNGPLVALPVDQANNPATTFSAGDKLQGSEYYYDHLRIVTSGVYNNAFPESATVKDFEVVTIQNTGSPAATLADASRYQGLRQLWQEKTAAHVINLTDGVTAGFREVDLGGSTITAVRLTDTARSAAIAFDEVRGSAANNRGALLVQGNALDSVTLVGTFVQATTTPDAAPAQFVLTIALGKDVETLTLNLGVATSLSVVKNGASVVDLRTIDASHSTGALRFDLGGLKASSSATAFDGGVVTLGAEADILTATAVGATLVGFRSGDTEDATSAGGADTLVLGNAVAAGDAAGADFSLTDGRLTFTGAGPASLAEALGIARAATTADNQALVFQYLSDSYVFGERTNASTADDVLIKLADTTGLRGLDTYAPDSVYVF